MSGEALGGGVMVAVAAALWVVYLIPTWSRRRQYLATERNAVRLQQTMRILAETAEVPQQVRLEANARTVNAQQRILAQAEDDARVEADAAEAAALAARRTAAALARASRPPVVDDPTVRLRRLRKWRALSSLVLLGGLATVVAGVVPVLVSGSWLVLGIGAVASVVAFGSLSRLARAARAARIVVAPPVQMAPATPRFEPVQLEETPMEPPTWTPQPLPKPLHLSRGSIAQAAMASVDAAEELRKATAQAEIAARAARIAPEVTPISRPAAARAAAAVADVPAAAPSEVPSRFANMGIVGETKPGMSDLDAVLRRRRAG